jgi:DNA-binding transcriptional ArsR family regulator
MNRRTEDLSEVAQTLHQIIKESPGIHFRSLGREAGLSSVGQLRHHLDTLRRHGAIVELQDGRFKRFFVAGEHDPRLRDGLSRFARRVPRRIAKLLLSRPMNRTEIRRNLNCADSTLGYHLNRMVELGDLKRTRGRNCCIYSLTEPEFVRYLLQHHPAPSTNRPGENGSNGHQSSCGSTSLAPSSSQTRGELSRSENGNGLDHPGERPWQQDRPTGSPSRLRPNGHRGVSDDASEKDRDDDRRSPLDPRIASRARLEDHRDRVQKKRDRDRSRDDDPSSVPSWLIST